MFRVTTLPLEFFLTSLLRAKRSFRKILASLVQRLSCNASKDSSDHEEYATSVSEW